VLKQILHKLFSLAMALLVLFSTVSFTVEKHYCGPVLIDVAVFSEAQDCGMKMNKVASETKMKKGCCKNEVQVLHGQDELKVSSFDDLEFDQQLFLAAFNFSFIDLFEGLAQQFVPHQYYSPPKLIVDRQILDQVFLI
jgi:hypothetical protein